MKEVENAMLETGGEENEQRRDEQGIVPVRMAGLAIEGPCASLFDV